MTVRVGRDAGTRQTATPEPAELSVAVNLGVILIAVSSYFYYALYGPHYDSTEVDIAVSCVAVGSAPAR